jgi:ATP-dependent protease ClpP protease subunit
MDSFTWIYETADYVRFNPHNNKRKREEPITADTLIYTVGNEVHFTATIDTVSIELIIKEIMTIIHEHEKENPNEKLTITYIVDSPGGAVSSVLKFVDFIRMVKSKYKFVEFTSVITGLVASAGTIMCIVADKRVMTQNSHAMIHELSAGKVGKYTHIVSHTEFLKKLHNMLIDIYMEKSNKTREELIDLLNKETWFSARQYKELGFVDDVK